MAKIEIVTNVTDIEVLKSKAFDPDAQGYKTLIKELIRLDVPILEVGSSSIGKSYSIREFMEEAGIRAEFLFVGTEKAEFIEGIPNLRGTSSDTAKFNYLKPYWFPDSKEIRIRLINGKNQLEQLNLTTDYSDPVMGTFKSVTQMWDAAKLNYSLVETLKEVLQKFKRTEEELKKAKVAKIKIGKFLYEDALLYLSTLQGYGNFWLILDEIDKVDKMDKDKYAPLLHIVRERELKGWKLSGMREFPEFDVKNTPDFSKRIIRLNAALLDDSVDITDTRIIAIANDIRNIETESPALYRRFVKIVIRKSLYAPKKQGKKSVATDESSDGGKTIGFDWTKWYESTRQELHKCIVVKPVPVKDKTKDKIIMLEIGKQMAAIEEKLVGFPLKEMNLQWTLGFLPDILFPGYIPAQAKSKVRNAIIDNFNEVPDPFETLFFKIVRDNFSTEYWKPLLECVHAQVDLKDNSSAFEDLGIDAKIKDIFDSKGMTRDKFTSPDVKAVDGVLAYYQKELDAVQKEYELRTKGQGKGQKSTTGGIAGAVQSALDSVSLGNSMIMQSMIDGKPTEFTRMLVSAIPFMQTRLIGSSPYITFEQATELTEEQNNGIIKFIEVVSGKSFNSENEAKEATTTVFGAIDPYKPYVIKYAVGITGKDAEDIVNGDYTKIVKEKRWEEVIEAAIANRPVIIDNTLAGMLVKQPDLKVKYYNSISSVRLIEKEIYTHLPGDIFAMMKNSCKADGLTDALKEEITDYCKKFPYQMIMLAPLVPKTTDYAGMADFMTSEGEKYKNSGTAIDYANAVI
jgi:hypothetical protein